MSRARPSLTGADNTDADSGEADAEVYLYDAEAEGGEGKLRCPSCIASGARPAGRNIGSDANPYWAAAQIPAAANQLSAPRVLSANGSRLFFESFDALLSTDTNSRQDVYQWESAGTGNCAEGVPGYRSALAGCLNLISSGQSPQDSQLVDSSASGADVFFKTASSLLAQDPGLIDIYDARVGGGFAPPPAPPAECEGESCQGPAAAPVPPTPASETYLGPANPRHSKAAKKCAKGKHKVKRNGKVRCVKKKKGKRQRKSSKRHSRPHLNKAARR